MANIPTISLSPQPLGEVAGFTINNAILTSVFTSVLILIFAFLVRRKAGVRPSKIQVIFEALLTEIQGRLEVAFGNKKDAQKFLPLMLTIFIFVLFANQVMLLPFMDSIVTEDGINIFRAPTSHYSLPIILTVFILLLSHVLALIISPIRHIGNFIKIDVFFKMKSIKDLPMALIDFFLGLLDIIGEFAKLASLSTRLFGNMFAGSIVAAIIGGLTIFTRFLVPMPFVALGILSGVVQAFVFTMLAMLYISSAINAVKVSTNN